MNEELQKAIKLLQDNGVKVDMPQEAQNLSQEQVQNLLQQLNALQAQVNAMTAAQAPAPAGQAAGQAANNSGGQQGQWNGGAPAVHVKENKGVRAGLQYLADKHGIVAPGLQVNTPMHTGNTGYGEEFVPSENLSRDIFEIVPEYQTFLNRLPGQHNNRIAANVGDSVTVPIIGMPGKMVLGSEKTADSAFAAKKQTHSIATDNVTLTTKKFVARYDITRELADFGIVNSNQWEQRIKAMAAAEWTRTIESAMINGDTETGGSANINLIDGTPGGTEHYLACDGLRKVAIGTTSPNADPDLGTLDTGDVYTMKKVVGNYFKPNQFLWLSDITTRDKFSTLDNFTDASKRGDRNTVENAPIDRLSGADFITHDDFPNTNAAGKVSGTPANNTKGGIVGFWTPCVQYGWIENLRFKIYDFGEQGFLLEFWGYAAITIINQKAGYSNNSTVVNGINATI